MGEKIQGGPKPSSTAISTIEKTTFTAGPAAETSESFHFPRSRCDSIDTAPPGSGSPPTSRKNSGSTKVRTGCP